MNIPVTYEYKDSIINTNIIEMHAQWFVMEVRQVLVEKDYVKISMNIRGTTIVFWGIVKTLMISTVICEFEEILNDARDLIKKEYGILIG